MKTDEEIVALAVDIVTGVRRHMYDVYDVVNILFSLTKDVRNEWWHELDKNAEDAEHE